MQKKYFIFICFFISSFINSSTDPLNMPEIWRNNFKLLQNPEWNDYDTTQNRWKKLGYDPHITLIEKEYNNTSSGPTLFIHDWASSKDAYNTVKLCSSNNIPGDVITFNFSDASRWFKQTIPYWMPFTKSNFAGKEDITSLLCVLKTLHSLQCLPTVWYADSQGADIAQAVAGILNQPSEIEQNLLTEWNIQANDRSDILSRLKIMYLLNPLTNVEIALNRYIQSKLFIFDYIFPILSEMISAKFNNKLPELPSDLKNELTTKITAIKKDPQSFVKKYITPVVKNYILPLLTHYNPKQKNPIDYISQLEGIQNTKIWLHLEEEDINIIQQLLLALPNEHLYVSYINNDGHNTFEALNNPTIGLIDAFNQTNECAYRWALPTQVATRIIQIAQLSKTMTQTAIEQHLNNFSKNYSQKGFWNHKITKTFIALLKISLMGIVLYCLKTNSYGIHEIYSKVTNQYLHSLKIDS